MGAFSVMRGPPYLLYISFIELKSGGEDLTISRQTDFGNAMAGT